MCSTEDPSPSRLLPILPVENQDPWERRDGNEKVLLILSQNFRVVDLLKINFMVGRQAAIMDVPASTMDQNRNKLTSSDIIIMARAIVGPELSYCLHLGAD